MKIIITTTVGVVVAGLAYFTYEAPVQYVKEQVEEATLEVVEVKVDVVEERIKNAQKDAMVQIEVEANSMRDIFIKNQLDQIEAETLIEIQKELKARQIEAEKRTGAY